MPPNFPEPFKPTKLRTLHPPRLQLPESSEEASQLSRANARAQRPDPDHSSSSTPCASFDDFELFAPKPSYAPKPFTESLEPFPLFAPQTPSDTGYTLNTSPGLTETEDESAHSSNDLSLHSPTWLNPLESRPDDLSHRPFAKIQKSRLQERYNLDRSLHQQIHGPTSPLAISSSTVVDGSSTEQLAGSSTEQLAGSSTSQIANSSTSEIAGPSATQTANTSTLTLDSSESAQQHAQLDSNTPGLAMISPSNAYSDVVEAEARAETSSTGLQEDFDKWLKGQEDKGWPL